MNFSLFLGCNIPARVVQYELSTRAVMKALGIGLVDLREYKCCGNPLRNTDQQAAVFMAARNLALAEKLGLPMLVLCKCCYGSLKKAAHQLNRDPVLHENVNRMLAAENLACHGKAEIKHLLSVLYHDIGVPVLKANVSRSFKKLHVATHYGCHALRPSDITEFDDPAAPSLFDDLVRITGAKSIDWPLKLECCGAPVLGINDRLSTDLTRRKLADGKAAGADVLCVACPYCQMQFENVQLSLSPDAKAVEPLPSVLFPQLLGLAMGLDGDQLGIDSGYLESFLI
jgi:heterodisulfide reductase subunit B